MTRVEVYDETGDYVGDVVQETHDRWRAVDSDGWPAHSGYVSTQREAERFLR